MISKLFLASTLGATIWLNQDKFQCCGFMGIISSNPKIENPLKFSRSNLQLEYSIVQLLCRGVQSFKNKGFDSAGIVVFQKDQQNLVTSNMVKYAGNHQFDSQCIERLVNDLNDKTQTCTSGLGHTRWATKGNICNENAHPHSCKDQEIYLVSNGTITNHQQIREKYLPKDLKLKSHTDSQVLVHLLNKQRKQGLNMMEALQKLSDLVSKESKWSALVIEKVDPDTIYAISYGEPILVGFTPSEEVLVVSQFSGFQNQIEYYFQAKEGQILKISLGDIPNIKKQMSQALRLKNHIEQTKSLKKLPQIYQSYYSRQVREQADITFKVSTQKIKYLNLGPYLTMAACGSSYNACFAAHHILKKLKCFQKINIIDPVQLDYYDIIENQTVVLVSQSGETKDLINMVDACKKEKGVKTIGFVNVEGSTIARKCDYPVFISVGLQLSIVATKSFYFQVMHLIQFATEVAQKKQSGSMETIIEIRNNLLNIQPKTSETIKMVEAKCKELASLIYMKESIILLAKRQGLAIAKQAALKIKQINYIHAQALGACQMKHGPIALIESNKNQESVVIILAFDNATFEQMMNALDQMHSRKAYVIMITDCQEKIRNHFKKNEQDQSSNKYHFLISVPHLRHLSHLLAIIPMQILVQEIAKIKKINPDKPRNLMKIVRD